MLIFGEALLYQLKSPEAFDRVLFSASVMIGSTKLDRNNPMSIVPGDEPRPRPPPTAR
jgi:hypothetical protein